MPDALLRTALFGASGAFVYAAPRLSACWTAPKAVGESRNACLFEFAVAIGIGAIGSAAFAPPVAEWRHLSDLPSQNALAVFVGLIFNPVAPSLINFAPRLTDAILTALKGKPND